MKSKPRTTREGHLFLNRVIAIRSHAIRNHGNDAAMLMLLGELEAKCHGLFDGKIGRSRVHAVQFKRGRSAERVA